MHPPVIEHSSVFWSGISSTDSVRLERLNRKAARLISNTRCRSDTPHDILLARAGLQELLHRRHLFQVLFTYRFVHTDLPSHIVEGLSHWLPDSTSQRSYLLRRQKTLRLPRGHKNILKRSPLYSAFSFWNSLLTSLLATSSVQSLKAYFHD